MRWSASSRHPVRNNCASGLREGFIGQERALRALKMGAELSAPGYNVFVCGLAGTSRGGNDRAMIEELHPPTKESLDRCYVNNFKLTDRPRCWRCSRQANNFKKDMQAESISAPPDSAGVRRRALPAAKRADRRTLHGARED